MVTEQELDLQAQITPQVIVDAFDFMGGDPSTAIESAGNYSSIEEWKAWQAGQAALVGAAAMAIPVAHIPLIVVDVAFLLHKMAYCCWGIGSLHGCEIESKEDFSVILGLYTGVVTEDVLIASVGTGSLALVGGQIANMGLPAFIGKLTGKGASMGAKTIGAKVGGKAAGKVIAASAPLISQVSGKVAEKITAKVAAKAATKAALKASSDFIAGFAPFLGALVAGGVNTYFVLSIADSADVYYRTKSKRYSSSSL